ncbi:hypothetical protein EC988_000764 [Linderina pennispora]|nr:hypothetical protein EC988_000764 [Linderina pennispora]
MLAIYSTLLALALTLMASVVTAKTLVSNRPLWGLCYSPYNNDGSCPAYESVESGLNAVADVAKNIRLFSTDCSQLKLALKAITKNDLDMGVYAGLWITDGDQRKNSDVAAFIDAAKAYNSSDLIRGVSVGNEETFKNMNSAQVVGHINDVRSKLRGAGLGHIPVYTTDVDSHFTPEMAKASDVVNVNVYSMFDGSPITMDQAVQRVIARANHVRDSVAQGKKVRISESGWAAGGNLKGMPLTLENQQSYLRKFKCAAEQAGFEYFFFEAKNADWKKSMKQADYEYNFGVFDSNFGHKLDFSIKC